MSGSLPYRDTAGPVDLAREICEEGPRPLSGCDAELENILQMGRTAIDMTCQNKRPREFCHRGKQVIEHRHRIV